MKKCLGPCINAVSEVEYGAAVGKATRLLRGEDRGLLDRAVERRDELGEQLRFEEAADLRDRIRDVEQVVAGQQRLAGFSGQNVVLVARDRQPDRARLLLIRAGRLVEEVSLPVRATPSHLRYLLQRVYGTSSRVARARQVSRDELDDVLILDAWRRRHREEVREVVVSAADPASAAGALRAALGSSP